MRKLCNLFVGVILMPFLFGCSGSGDAEDLVQPDNWWNKLPRPGYASLEKVGTYQNWFEVYKLPDGTFAIYEPYQFEEVVSYLVLGSERGVIIDTGTGIGNIKSVVEELTDLPVSVVNTHSHYDHVGGNFRFDEVAIYGIASATDRLIEGVENEWLQRLITSESIWKPLPEGFNSDTWTIPPVEPTYLLDDGTTIELGGRTLEIIHTPGHSPGSVCLLDRENRVLFTGDTFYPGPLYAHTADTNIEDYRASLRLLSSLTDEYDHVLSGHNEPWIDSEVIPRVDDAITAIFSGEGKFEENEGLRRYFFDGFDILILTDMIK